MVIYIGNLPTETDEHELAKMFEQYGQVSSVHLMRDGVSGNALGFAFVEMPRDREASEAIKSLNRTKVGDRVVMVCETPGRTERRHSAQKPSAHGRGE